MKVSDIPVGYRLFLGRYTRPNDSAPSELTWFKCSQENEFVTCRNIGNHVIDEVEPENESRGRRERGSNFFPQTNICQVLNSAEKDWFNPQHDTDTAKEVYRRRPGFLKLFEDWELRFIVPHEVVSVVPEGFKRKFGEISKSMMKVSIPSVSQVLGGENQEEGKRLPGYETGDVDVFSMATRTPIGTGIQLLDRNMHKCNRSPSGSYPIYPYIHVDGNAEVYFDEEPWYYHLIPSEDYVKSIIEELEAVLQ